MGNTCCIKLDEKIKYSHLPSEVRVIFPFQEQKKLFPFLSPNDRPHILAFSTNDGLCAWAWYLGGRGVLRHEHKVLNNGPLLLSCLGYIDVAWVWEVVGNSWEGDRLDHEESSH